VKRFKYYTDWKEAVNAKCEDKRNFYNRVSSVEVASNETFNVEELINIKNAKIHIVFVEPITRFQLLDLDE